MKRSIFFYLKRVFYFLFGFILILVIGIGILFFSVSGAPEEMQPNPNEVNDVTQLNPIGVNEIVQPQRVDEIVALIKSNDGPISIGGARHSMGGQIGSDRALHIDMRAFDNVIAFDKENKEITVQTGITWRKIQEYIDPENLSVMIMQTYADFTVGGSLSVNVHGRYIGSGPLIHSVRSIKVILSDGSIVTASREENPELFRACVGGYGGLGVIVEATLRLADNSKVERQSVVMKVSQYHDYFMTEIRNDSAVIFHNGDIYPEDYTDVRAVSYVRTNKPVTNPERLKPLHQGYRVERFGMWLVSEAPFGKWIRKHWVDPLFYKKGVVEWRNYEASYDAQELEPTSRTESTYVLQEYFIPVDHFDSFVPRMATIFQNNDVNVINVSIRHALPDTLSLLSWAPREVFCLVVYYKQGTSMNDQTHVGEWTRQLIDAALSAGGSYYLPYQLHASKEQFHKAYPHARDFFSLKNKTDSTNKFRNRLWDKYFTEQ